MNSQVQDPKLQQILDQISKFGFAFFNYDESGMPLVKGPNNQIVPINVAIDFVNKQIEYARQSASSGSPESMPVAPESSSQFESGAERSIEIKSESALERKQEQQTQQVAQKEMVVPQKAPQVKIQQPQIKLYGDGFDPKSFNPSDIKQTLKYIERNTTKPATSSHKWLAEQFKKFLRELDN